MQTKPLQTPTKPTQSFGRYATLKLLVQMCDQVPSKDAAWTCFQCACML